jgi:tetratricopeptide (TPR) repeat protein
LFGVEPLPPLRARGSAEALKIYRVLRAKPRLARLVSREFEGVETRLVGREAELLQAQKAFEAAQEDREAHLVTILGEIGMGKSRLIYEFEKWRDLRPELVRIFRGRAAPESAAKPYALLRDLLMFRFELHDSDSPATLRAQIERGFADLMGEQAPEHAHLVGQLAGFDFDDSPHVRPLLGNAAQLHDRALRSLGQFFRATAQAPGVTTLMVIIEGLQWADDKSLEALRWLMRENAATPLLVMGAARPGLLERYPAWGAEHPNHTRLELRPLPKRETRKLVREVLQKVAELPDALRDLIAERSEGNPFYIEEMARMLLEDRVIVKGPDHWRVDTARLAGVRVPPTLTGLLQARLDSLTPDERTALQRAAVIGRIFWDTAVSALEGGDGLPIASFEALESLRKREFIHAQASSLFVGAHEYIFASQLLRDVAYESALQRQRRAYHARAAAWLLQTAGERAEEYTAHIAEHYERAGDAERAAAWFRRSGEQAHGISAYREAIAAYDRALAVLPAATGDQTRAVLLIRVASVYEAQADYDNARTRLQTALEMAQTAGDLRAAAEALSGICWLLYRQSDFERASRVGLKALDLARQAGDKAVIALTLWRLGVALYYQQHYESATARFQESLSVFQALGNLEGVARCFNTLGEVARYQKDYARAAEYYAQALDLVRQSGNRERIAAYLGNLGENARYQGDYAAAARHYHESLTVSNEIGARNLVAWHQINLGHVAVGLDDLPEAERRYREGIAEAHAMGVKTLVLDGLVGMAALWAKRDNWRRAAEMVGLALAHPALGPEGKSDSEIAFALLRAAHTPAEIEMAYAQGKALNLDEVVEELLK